MDGRRSAGETRRLLVSTVRRLLATTPSDQLTVRLIAEHAGVQHSLITRYFGSKDHLIETARTEVAADWAAAILDAEPDEALGIAFSHLLENPGDATALAMAASQRISERIERPYPVAGALALHLAGSDPDGEADPLDIAAAMALMLAWTVGEDMWLRIAGLDPTGDRQAARRRVLARVEHLARFDAT